MKLTGAIKPITSQPQGINTPAPGVATTPVGQYVYNSYNDQVAQANAQNQGLYGLAGTIGSAAIGLSDRRMKTDIRRVAKLDNGLPVYTFRYRGSDAPQLGLMADEVKELHPGAIINIGGLDYVDYTQAVR